MFNQKVYANSRPGGVGVMEIVDESEVPQFVPLRRTELRGEVIGPLAVLTVAHTYGYSREECDKVLEAVYRFPLPGDAAVTGTRVRFGDVEIVAQLKEREQAEAEYREAVKQGKQATLLTRESPDVFSLRVAGIQPDEEVLVETDYIQLARPYGDTAGWVLRVPLTTAPRYVREDEMETRHAQGQPLAVLRDPGHRFALNVLLHDVGEIVSLTHRIETFLDEHEHDRRVQLREGEVIPDRDFVLTWTPHQDPDRPSLSVLSHEDKDDGYTYFMALVAPPSAYQPGDGVAREIILLVDHSGSMAGAKWEASDWTVNNFFFKLTDHDMFALGLFHNTTTWFKSNPVPGTDANLRAAAKFLDKNRSQGGTNLGIALEQALQRKRGKEKDVARHVLIVTDAQVSDAGRLFRLADHETARGDDARRISVLCIDAAPNSFLANELAERGGGVTYFLTSNPDAEDITSSLENVLQDWSEPVLTSLTLEINRPGGLASGRRAKDHAQKTVIDLGDLPCGRAIWVAGRLPNGEGELTFRAVTPKKEVGVLSLAPSAAHPAIKALFGARRLSALEYLIHARYSPEQVRAQLKRMGYDPDDLEHKIIEESVYVENAYKLAQDALKPLLVSESLRYGIACAETAFVAVRSEAGKPVEATAVVANALPGGWSEDFASRSMSMGLGLGQAQTRMMADVDAAPAPVLSAPMEPPRAKKAGPAGMGRQLLGDRMERADRPSSATRVVFSGEAQFTDGKAVLFDSTESTKLPEPVMLKRLEIDFKGSAPQSLDRGLQLQLFVGDLAMPRATIRLADLLRGGRPLHLNRAAGQIVRIVLVDPNGVWASGAPKFSLKLGW